MQFGAWPSTPTASTVGPTAPRRAKLATKGPSVEEPACSEGATVLSASGQTVRVRHSMRKPGRHRDHKLVADACGLPRTGQQVHFIHRPKIADQHWSGSGADECEGASCDGETVAAARHLEGAGGGHGDALAPEQVQRLAVIAHLGARRGAHGAHAPR